MGEKGRIPKFFQGIVRFEYALIDGTIVRVHQHGTGAKGGLAVIPPKADRKIAIACDFAMYRWRHLVENNVNRP